jgi:DNA-binding Lrp family transcriptional regulator
MLGISEDQVLEQARRWQEAGILREISAVLEGSALGHESALVATRVEAGRLEDVAAVINRHPTVTHNYERNHHYNLWYTIAAPLDIGLEPMVACLSRQVDCEMHILRRTMTFKIGVNFDLKSKKSITEASTIGRPEPREVSERDRRNYRTLQRPLPLVSRPFKEQAALAGISEDELLEFAHANLGNTIRRYVSTLRHRKIGVRGNGMVVWNAPEERLAELGPALAETPEVSHCYARDTAPGFPFNLYSMMHGPDRDAVEETARLASQRLDLPDYHILFSSQEFKKCRLRYFLPELDQWWQEHGS